MDTNQVPKVYGAIAEVTRALTKEGIGKSRKNAQQGYSFRGIDDVYNALAPFLADAKLCILPNVLERAVVEREAKSGQALFYTTVKVDFAFVSAEDGSEHHVVTYGEAMDSGDKSTNKAMSAAYKYAAMQSFCIPTEGDNDADSQTHEVKAAPERGATPTGGVFETLTIDQQNHLLDIYSRVHTLLLRGDVAGAYAELKADDLGGKEDMKVGLWSRFDSKERRALGDYGDKQRQKEKAAA